MNCNVISERRFFARLGLAVLYTAVLLYAGLQVTSSPMVWGGTLCEITGFGHVCAGYPPTGLFALLVVGVFLALVTADAVERVVISNSEVE